MALRLSALAGGGVTIGQAVFLEDTQPSDLTIYGRRYLQSGNIETDDTLFDTSIFTSRHEVNKVIHTTTFAGTSPRGLEFGAGVYVLVGDNGNISTSTDLVTWTDRSNPFGSEWCYCIKFLGGQFIIGGQSGSVMTSPDGITWTERTSPITQALYGFAINDSNDMIVGVANSGKIISSPDGITWTERTSGSAYSFRGIVFGAGIFVGAGLSGLVATSPDGITWTVQTSGFASSSIYAVGYHNGVFITTGASSKSGTSVDGINWDVLSNLPYICYSLRSIEGEATILGGCVSGVLVKTYDGITWTVIETSVFGDTSLLFDMVMTEDTLAISTTNNTNVVEFDRSLYAGSTIAHAENGENQYVRIS